MAEVGGLGLGKGRSWEVGGHRRTEETGFFPNGNESGGRRDDPWGETQRDFVKKDFELEGEPRKTAHE